MTLNPFSAPATPEPAGPQWVSRRVNVLDHILDGMREDHAAMENTFAGAEKDPNGWGRWVGDLGSLFWSRRSQATEAKDLKASDQWGARLMDSLESEGSLGRIRAACNSNVAATAAALVSVTENLRAAGLVPERADEVDEDGNVQSSARPGRPGDKASEYIAGGAGEGDVEVEAEIAFAIGKAADEAAEAAEATREATEAFGRAAGTGDGTGASAEFAADLYEAFRSNPHLAKFLALIGREAKGIQRAVDSRKVSPRRRPGFGDDIHRALPEEQGLLGTPLEADLLYRMTQRAVRQWVDDPPKGEEQGPFVAAIDASGSMGWAGGFKRAAACGVAAALVALGEGRAVRLLRFDTRVGASVDLEPGTDPRAILESIMTVASFAEGGGTSFRPVQASAREFSAAHEGDADLLLITDGEGWFDEPTDDDPRLFVVGIGLDPNARILQAAHKAVAVDPNGSWSDVLATVADALTT